MDNVNPIAFLLAKRILLFIGAHRFCLVGQEAEITLTGDFGYLESAKIALATGVELGRGDKEITKERFCPLFCFI